jgi:hypothetical protein
MSPLSRCSYEVVVLAGWGGQGCGTTTDTTTDATTDTTIDTNTYRSGSSRGSKEPRHPERQIPGAHSRCAAGVSERTRVIALTHQRGPNSTLTKPLIQYCGKRASKSRRAAGSHSSLRFPVNGRAAFS